MPEEQRGIILHVDRHELGLLNLEIVRFKMHTGHKAEKGQVFIPLTNEQADSLEGFNRTHKTEPGYASLTLLHGEKRINWNKFYPFGTKKQGPTGMGIGSRIHHAIVEYLAKNYQLDKYTVLHVLVSNSARKQLSRIGIEQTAPHLFPAYRQLVKTAVTNRFGTEPKVEMP